MISIDVRNPHPACNIPIVPDRSCSEELDMIDEIIELKLQCFYRWITTSCNVK